MRWGTVVVITCVVIGCGQSTVFDRTSADVDAPSPDASPLPDISVPDLDCTEDSHCGDKLVCCDGVCTAEIVCREPTPCEMQGDPCRISNGLSFQQQGDFVCVALDQSGPVCIATCEVPFSVSGCPSETFCLNVNSPDGALRLCLPSECSSSRDCGESDTCVPFGNHSGFCFTGGPAQHGQSCSGEIRCDTDLYCVRENLRSTCQPLCDMWSGDGSRCSAGDTCGYLTLGTGVCRAQTDTGREIGESCAPQGIWCSSGVQCFDFRTGGESLPVCTAWCRPGRDDCRGRFQNHTGFCRTVFSTGDGQAVEDFGLCL